MGDYRELAKFSPAPKLESRTPVPLDEKIAQRASILGEFITDEGIREKLTPENFRIGLMPRLSIFDVPYIPIGTQFEEIPHDKVAELETERAYDLIRWNQPSRFLYRLAISKKPYEAPIAGRSPAMDRFVAERRIVSFDNLRIDSPAPKNGRQSRSSVNNGLEINIMGQGRIPFALGSVPDVGSFLSYVTMAQANGMAFISRDKLLSDIGEQAKLAGDVINFLRNVHLPKALTPTDDELTQFAQIMGLNNNVTRDTMLRRYNKALRDSWIGNVGAAIEASPQGIDRAIALYDVGCKLFRIYSPEGGTEIVETVKKLRATPKFEKEDVKIVGGQIMDLATALQAQKAGCNALFIGVAGGSQCTTSVDADIPVKTPNLLYDLRGTITIPIGIEGGGVGTHIMTAFALGASFVSKPGEIGVSREGSGGKYMFRDPDGKLFMVYGGEASVSAKWWKDSVDDLGRPKFVEGETGVREVAPDRMSMTGNIKKLRDRLSNGLVFQRANSISELHQRTCENVVEVSTEASSLSQAYGK